LNGEIMLKKCIALLFLIAQASMHAADQTNLVYIDIQDPFTRKVQSTIPMPVTNDTTFADLQSELNKTMACYTRIEGLRIPNVDYSNSSYNVFIDANLKVKDTIWGSLYPGNKTAYLQASLPYPSGIIRVRNCKDVV
jgi:hypothetical protein